MDTSPKRWTRGEQTSQRDYGIFTVVQYQAVSPRTDRPGTYVEILAPDWVNVIAFTERREVVLVRQYRHGIAEITLEIPSGMVEPAETPLDAARRELAEETGYSSDNWLSLGLVHPNPAYQSNCCHTFLARNCHVGGEQHLDPGEDIAIQLASLADVAQAVRSGEIDHALVIAAFLRYVQVGQPDGTLF